MVSELDITDEDLEVFDAQQLVKGIADADTLADIVTNDEHHWAARNDAAAKLIELWEKGCQNSVTLDHLAHISDHAEEPYKSQANQIIRTSLRERATSRKPRISIEVVGGSRFTFVNNKLSGVTSAD